MSVYIVQGKLGTGKGKYVVGKMQEALRAGKRVATNVDLFMEHLLPHNSNATVVRVPDKPTAADLDAAGHGNPDSYDEEKNGVLVLDELGSWLNARSFQNEHRAGILDWLIHARKKGWDVYLIVQNVDMIDKQVRVGLAEYLVKCIRADKIKIPIIGTFLGKRGRFPRFHIAQMSMADVPGIQVDKEMFRGDDLHAAYDTRQIFRDWARYPTDRGFEDETYMGPFSYLSPYLLAGRYEVAVVKQTLMQRLFKVPVKPLLKPKHPLIEKLAKLSPDKAWHFARILNNQGVITC
jgi:hypothetical protein